MINKLKPKSEFSRNVLTLMTGTTIAQAIPIAISPILTRIYTPEDFGILALFIAIASIFGSIANGRYELAIMLPKKDEDAINIFALGFIITSVISLTLLILVILFHDYFVTLLNNKEIGIWLYFVPIAVFFTGLFNILNYFNNRKKHYKDIANANIIKSIISAVTQLSIGFVKSGVLGLISGHILSQIFANMRLLKNIIKDKILMSKISKIKIMAIAKRYRKFPIYLMPATLFNTLSFQLISVLISTYFSIITLGFFSLVNSVLNMPLKLISQSIGQVYLQQAADNRKKKISTLSLFKNTFSKLFLFSLIIFGVLFISIESIFIFVFGEKWLIAGEYAQILIPLFMIRFISSTMSINLIIYEKQKGELVINMLLMFSLIFAIYIYHDNFLNFLNLYVFQTSALYLIFLYYYFKLSVESEKNE